MAKKENNVSSFIKKIESIKSDSINVYIPSRQKEHSFQSLNLKQQKDIISSVADGIAGVVGFSRILNNVIIESGDDKEFKIYDRAPAAVALRVDALGSEYKKDDKEVDLNEVLERFKEHEHTLPDEKTVKYKGIEVDVVIPTLSEENAIIKKLEEEVKRNGEQSNTKNLGSIYIYELVKYIKEVRYKETTIDYTSLRISDKIQLIESLPLALNKLVIRYIEEFRKEEREILTIDDVVVEIDPSFFDAE